MDVRDLVRRHYGTAGLEAAVVAVLADAGVDVEHLTPPDLSPVDQLHAGGAAATAHLLGRMALAPGSHLLDVGCGIGGPARQAAGTGLRVTGVDLTPDFVVAAAALSTRVGLAASTRFETTPAERLALPDHDLDAAMLVHVGMNVPDKQALFAEVRRVLRPGAPFALFEQVRTGEGALAFPMPWAEDERSSFVETVDDYVRKLVAAGFTVEDVEDRTASTLGGPPPGPVSPVAVFGPRFADRLRRNVEATRAGLLGAVLVLARAEP